MQQVSVGALVAAMPRFSGRTIAVRPLHGGITNQNYVVTCEGAEYVVRIPGERTELLGIDRANESEAASRAADLGIGPPVVGVLPTVGTLVTELVPGLHLDTDRFVARLPEVVDLIQRFHSSGKLRGTFPIHRVIEWHARDAGARGVMAPHAYERLHQQSRRIEAAFAKNPLPTVPCHNDLLPANVLFGEDRAWLLDFEYAGMNDMFFDLGNLSVNCGLDTAAEEQLLVLYFGEVTRSGHARLQLMKMMSEFREGMWAVVQQAISTLDTDFVSYANERLGNCEALASRPAFEQWLVDAAEPVL
jgi:thiamine kinase-like enzyme